MIANYVVGTGGEPLNIIHQIPILISDELGLTIVQGLSAKVQYKMRVDVEYGAPKLGRLQPVPDLYVDHTHSLAQTVCAAAKLTIVTCSIQNEISYLPRTRPLLRELPPFPLLPTREDWPFTRETIGGWSLTPFGGRGRFDGRMVDVEGIVSHHHFY